MTRYAHMAFCSDHIYLDRFIVEYILNRPKLGSIAVAVYEAAVREAAVCAGGEGVSVCSSSFFNLSCKDRSRMLNLAIVAGVAGVVSVRRGRIESVKSNSSFFFKAESTNSDSSLKLSLSISRSRQGSAASAMIANRFKFESREIHRGCTPGNLNQTLKFSIWIKALFRKGKRFFLVLNWLKKYLPANIAPLWADGFKKLFSKVAKTC